MGKLFKSFKDMLIIFSLSQGLEENENKYDVFPFKTSFYRNMKIANHEFWIKNFNHILYIQF